MATQASLSLHGSRTTKSGRLMRGILKLSVPLHWLGRGLLALLLLIGMALLLAKLADPQTLPIRKIRVQGVLSHIDQAMLQRAVAGRVQGGYFNLDVRALQTTLEQLPWVRVATVRRIWPDSIVLGVIEQQPLARWREGGLVNPAGQVFRPAEETWPSGLPLFAAPAGKSELIGRYYRTFSRQLAATDLRIAAIHMDARRAIWLKLDNGMQVVLGREAQSQRLQRFVKVYVARLASYGNAIKRVDLRYSNGMAVQWSSKKE